MYAPCGLEIERFQGPPDPDLVKQFRADGRYVFGMIGRFHKQKAPHLLAQAVGLLKERGELPNGTRVIFVGERIQEDIQAKFDEVISRYDLKSVVQQYPPTSYPEAVYHACDVMVLASLYEGLPNVVLESLAAGRPMVISEGANQAGIIENNVTGWIVRTGDVEHLAEILTKVLRISKDDLTKMKAACVHRIEQFAMTHYIERWQSLYERLR
jgi:glycosyltransferase involved in cell wall biosynthesis